MKSHTTLILLVILLLFSSSSARSQWQEYEATVNMSFPAGYHVVKEAGSNSEVIKVVPGPTEAAVKGSFRNDSGDLFYLSDWSWDRRIQGLSFFWMLPLGNPENHAQPDLPPGYEWREESTPLVLAHGYETVAEVSPTSTSVHSFPNPVMINVRGTAIEDDKDQPLWTLETFYLDSNNYDLWKAGEPFLWFREIKAKERPDLIPRLTELGKDHPLMFEPARYSSMPWKFSAELYNFDRKNSIIALKEVGITPYLRELSHHFEDQEFPYLWFLEVAKFLNTSGELTSTIEILKANFPNHEVVRQLNQQYGDEMAVAYVGDQMQFDRRLIAILEAERKNFAEVEAWLSPLLVGWNPADDGLNASGPRINILREVARSQWKQGNTDDARANSRLWLDAYSRNIASDLLHPDYVDASQRVMEFDPDFEAVGDYFDLLEAITDPQTAAEIVVGLKGLQLAVTSSQQVRFSSQSDPALSALSSELIRLIEVEQQSALAGSDGDLGRTQRISEIHSDLAMRRLSGENLDLARLPAWAELSAEIDRRLRAGDDKFDVRDEAERRDIIALNHLITAGNFIASPDAVAKKLRPGEVLLDFFELSPTTPGEPSVYGALVISENRPPQLLRLGEADAIDAAIRDFRDLMEGVGSFSNDSLETLQEKTRGILTKCHDLIARPLLPHIESASRLIICPEGQLLFLPFDSLDSGNGKLLGSQWEITYVNAARDLLREHSDTGSTPLTALLVGNPHFGSASAAVSEAPIFPHALNSDKRSVADLAEASRGIEFSQLSGTQEEISTLAPRLTEAGYLVKTLTGEDATESNLTNIGSSPTILHFATHGFFFNALPVANRRPEESDSRSAMLLSGLALTGAQNTLEAWNRGSIPPTGNDGIFLASEVSRLDLTGTRTVILSACETAVGKALSGEGVEGLRSGLTLAGAESVLITLWAVDDTATIELMEVFYSKILAGVPAPIAIAETKRELFDRIAKTKGEYLAHRLIGPFIVTRSGSLPP